MDGRGQKRRVLIGVQARTHSTRLPNKINLDIGGQTLLEKVMESCLKAEQYLNRNPKFGCHVQTRILCPGNDPLMLRYGSKYHIQAFPNLDDSDVLSRYLHACETGKFNNVVRITSDCYFTEPFLISRCVKTAIFDDIDYVSNTVFRTFREGMDTEVVSSALLKWLSAAATGTDREHVTSLLNQGLPDGYIGHAVTNNVDDSYIKTSIDTKEDYDRVVAEVDSIKTKRQRALSQGWGVS
jgi:spore coat polysaccharide biosynthesis protein SpsF